LFKKKKKKKKNRKIFWKQFLSFTKSIIYQQKNIQISHLLTRFIHLLTHSEVEFDVSFSWLHLQVNEDWFEVF